MKATLSITIETLHDNTYAADAVTKLLNDPERFQAVSTDIYNQLTSYFFYDAWKPRLSLEDFKVTIVRGDSND